MKLRRVEKACHCNRGKCNVNNDFITVRIKLYIYCGQALEQKPEPTMSPFNSARANSEGFCNL